ncbi:MAG: hypothetical protein HY238_04300 [Acidobacteria bacterium]|nr:hypothetical protein [Acidobacteriota bacterium]
MRPGSNTIESYKASMAGDPLRIREEVPPFAREGWQSLGPADKDLLKWVGVFFRRPTPGRFMMRIRMPNGFATSEQLRGIAELSRRLGNSVLDITTRQQVELRGFTIESVPEIWEKLRGISLHSLQTGMDNVRNLNGCPLAGLTPHELLDASPVLFELDRLIVGSRRQPRVRQPAPEVQHHRHRVSRKLHPQRVAGRGPGAGAEGGSDRFQHPGGGQDGVRRVYHRLAARGVCGAARGGAGGGRDRPHLSRSRPP